MNKTDLIFCATFSTSKEAKKAIKENTNKKSNFTIVVDTYYNAIADTLVNAYNIYLIANK